MDQRYHRYSSGGVACSEQSRLLENTQSRLARIEAPHAAGNLVAPAAVDEFGKPVSFDAMELQIRQTYENARLLLERFGASFDDVVEETLYVLDVDVAFPAAARVRKNIYGSEAPQVASNLIGVNRLAFPQQLVEVTFRAVADRYALQCLIST